MREDTLRLDSRGGAVQAFIRLLALRDSPLAAALRVGLKGLHATLSETLQKAPTDQGASACRSLLEELAVLLHESTRSPCAVDPLQRDSTVKKEEKRQTPSPEPSLREPLSSLRYLSGLREDVEGSPQLQERLGPFRLRSRSDADLWGEIQRLFLRLSPAEARSWLRRVGAVLPGGGLREAPPTKSLCDEADEEIYAGLTGSVEATGLQLSTGAPLHPLLGNGPWEGDAARIAPHVSFCLHFVDLDPSLHHALEILRPLGVHALTGEQKEGYVRELLSRFHELRKAGRPLDALHAWIRLDEAIQSLIHLPPAKPMSWWHQHQQRARQRLQVVAERARQEGHRVHIRWLTGLYRQVKGFSKNDWGLEFGGNLGEVLACLRVYAEIDGQAYPGRVVYRDY
jgi:hypothetical protein